MFTFPVSMVGQGASSDAIASLALANVSLRYVARSDYVTLSSSNVTALQDVSGNDNHLSASSSVPTWAATGLGGKPTIVHTPNQWLEFANSTSTQISSDMTWYCVAAYSNYGDGEFNTILEKGPHASGLNYLFGKAAFFSSTVFQNNQKFTYNDGSFRDVLESTAWIGTNNQFYIFTTVVDKANGLVKFYVDGDFKSSVSNALTYSSSSTTGGRIGANGTSTEGFNGAWSEQVLDRAAHNSTTVAANVAALAAYWGISI